MPNVQKETGMTDEAHERIRRAMCTINREMCCIRQSQTLIQQATRRISQALWPRTDGRLHDDV